MSPSLLTVVAIAGGAALASLAGGVVAMLHRPSTLFMSIALGFASGVLLATIAFEMMPQALSSSGLLVAASGFVLGFAAVYGFDLYIHRGKLVGEHAEQRPQVERFYQHRAVRGGEVTVLAGGTSAEELIEGLSIGVGMAIKPGVGLLIAIAIAIDNFAEALSIGEIIRHERPGRVPSQARRILGWTGLIAASLFLSALCGWLFLRRLADVAIGFLFAVGAGGMFYLTVTDLVPQSEEAQYQQSAAISMGFGFLLMFGLSAFF